MNKTLRLLIALLVLGALRSPAQEYAEYFVAEKKFLRLPVKNGAAQRNIEIWKDGVKVRYFSMELTDTEPDWYAWLNLSEWKGKKLEIRISPVPDDPQSNATQSNATLANGSLSNNPQPDNSQPDSTPSTRSQPDGSPANGVIPKALQSLLPLYQSDVADEDDQLYKETYRAQLRFSPKRGWTNDPNGLVYYQGQYHLFFQHNPYGRDWGNMTWGHAVSQDLIHWKELDPVLHPDGFGTMFSGSAVVDSTNTSGLARDGHPPLVMYFTGAGSWCQGMAWSTDGLHFAKLDYAPVPRINKDNRDPKIFWYEPGKHWVLLFWVPTNDGAHTQHFFKSDNLRDWIPTSVFTGGKGDDRYLYECPDLFELPVDGNPNNRKWVLSAANTEYAIGTFDGERFTPEQERLRGQFGRSYYAAQTVNNEPQGRRIEIGWWHTKTNKGGMNFTGSMSIPMELKLITTPAGIRMIRLPIKEVESLRSEKLLSGARSMNDKSVDPFSKIETDLFELEAEIEVGKAKEIRFNLNGMELVYDVVAQEMAMDGVKANIPLEKGLLQLRVFVDRVGVELFANNGKVFMPVDKNLEARTSSLKVTGGKVRFRRLDVYKLKSIWD
ncbi:MAG TPA: glycoside hydrolase family 32 protein [Flavihumibacter sp.]